MRRMFTRRPAIREAFELGAVKSEERGQRRMFHDGAYTSATKLIADVGAARFPGSTRHRPP